MIRIIDNFITPEEEKDILSSIRTTSVTSGKGRNMITRFGSALPYKAPIQGPIPQRYLYLLKRIVEKKVMDEEPDSITINEYHPGQCIDWHIDSPSSGPVIVVLSLLSEAGMGLKQEGDNEILYILPPRTLVVMTDEHRTEWKHCIYPVHSKRFSMVFRKGTKV
jgi:alkylated DNA repair dioxygenase AlkB